jgi:hypothetical protein
MNLGIGLCWNCETRRIENRDTGLCASCSKMQRKAEETAKRDAEKLARKLLKANQKAKEPRVKVKPISNKMRENLKEYAIVRKEHLTEFPECQLKFEGCEVIATDIHHTAGRGINLCNKSTFKSACRHCHHIGHTELSADEARELGFKTSAINQEKPII